MKQVLKSRQRSGSSEKGVATVELALMLPFLILFLVVIIDLGVILREHQVLSNAAREGARYSALPKAWIAPNNPTATEADIKNRVIEYCSQENITVNASQITVDQAFPIDVGGATLMGSRITVTVQRPLMFLGRFLGIPTVTMTGRSVFANTHS